MDDRIGIEELWPDAYSVDWPALEDTKSEDAFGEASFELLKEAGILSHMAAGLVPESALDRNSAILYALMLKTSKLSKSVIAMTAHLGADRQLAIFRELIEAVATLVYLLDDDGTGDRLNQYVNDSLVAEREFMKTIQTNVKNRGSSLEIENSMQRSIDNTASAAGVTDLNLLPGRAKIAWPKAEELLKGLGENVYPSYRTGSSVLHTKWSDLLRNHLRHNADGTFELRFEDTDPRPQPL